MSANIVHIMNSVLGIENSSYLELGTYDRANFDPIRAGRKLCVDTNGKGDFTGTTDEFFRQNKERWDYIFIDANHDIDYVVRDWNNSIQVCNKAILLHDMIPSNEEQTQSKFCSNSFLLLNHFMDNGFRSISLNHDFGLTVVKSDSFSGIEYIDTISFTQFQERINRIFLWTLSDFIEYINHD